MKPLILYTESSNHVGGQELQSLLQMEGFIQQQYEVLLACREKSAIYQQAKARGIPVIAIRFRNSFHLPSIIALRRLIKSRNPILMICHSGHDANNLAIAAKTLVKRPPIIRQKTYLTSRIKSFGINWLSDRVIVPSAAMQARMVDAGCHPEKFQVVNPGFDFQKLSAQSQTPLPDPVQEWLKSSGDPVIIQVGMLRGEKGHRVTLEALARLHAAGYAFRYLVVGDGDMRPELEEKAAEYGLSDRVMFAGSLFPVAPIYKQAQLLVMPSNNEAFGMALVEALYMKVPVIGSQVGGIPEVVHHGETGLLVPPNNAAALSEAIEDFLKSPDRHQKMAESGHTQVIEHCALENCLKKILQLGEKVP